MNGVHFASLHAIRSCDGTQGHIVLEFSADGAEDEASKRIFAALEPMFRPVFMMSSDWSDGTDFASFMKAHRSTSTMDCSAIPAFLSPARHFIRLAEYFLSRSSADFALKRSSVRTMIWRRSPGWSRFELRSRPIPN